MGSNNIMKGFLPFGTEMLQAHPTPSTPGPQIAPDLK